MRMLSDQIGKLAVDYQIQFGDRAIPRIDDDINRAIGRSDWDDCHRLQSARLRLRRLELYEEIARRLRVKATPGPVAGPLSLSRAGRTAP